LRIWSAVTGPLSRRPRAISISSRHCRPGHWDRTGTDHTIAQHVVDVIGSIEAIGTGSVDLMGHSRGGHISFRLAPQRSDPVRRPVLAEPVATHRARPPALNPRRLVQGTLSRGGGAGCRR